MKLKRNTLKVFRVPIGKDISVKPAHVCLSIFIPDVPISLDYSSIFLEGKLCDGSLPRHETARTTHTSAGELSSAVWKCN